MTTPDHAAVLARLDNITKGEWRVCSDETVTVRDERDGAVASLGWLSARLAGPRRSSAEVHANARAIALLPELIAVAKAAAELREIVRKAADKSLPDDEFNALMPPMDAATAKLDAALSALAKRGME